MGPTFSLAPVFLGDDVGAGADAIIAINDTFSVLFAISRIFLDYLLLWSSIFTAFPDISFFLSNRSVKLGFCKQTLTSFSNKPEIIVFSLSA